MLASIRVPLPYHHTSTSTTDVPRLSTPAAIPGLIIGLKWTIRQGTLGEGVGRWRRVGNGVLDHPVAWLAVAGEAGAAEYNVCRDVFAG